MPSPVIQPVLIRPIPAQGAVDVSVTQGAVGGPLVVRDMTGRIVLDRQVEALHFRIDLEGWPTGRYTVWTAQGSSPLLVH